MKALVAGIGNIFFGDDGVGVAVAQALQHEVRAAPLPDGAEVMDVGIRAVHLSFALMEGYDLVILVDAARRGQPPGTVTVLEPDLDGTFAVVRDLQAAGEHPLIDSHGMGPVDVLAVLETVSAEVAEVRLVLIEPQLWTAGLGLSAAVEAAIPTAVAQVRRLLEAAAADPTADDHGPAPEPTGGGSR